MSPMADVRALTMRPTSSLPALPKVAVRSRLASCSSPATQRSIGRVIDRQIRLVSRKMTTTAAPRAVMRTTFSRLSAWSADFLSRPLLR